MGELDVTIVGCGIARLSCAIILRPNARSITMLEKAEDISSMNIPGAGFTQYTSAANILRDALGLQPIDDSKMVQGHSIKVFDWQGAIICQKIRPTNDWVGA